MLLHGITMGPPGSDQEPLDQPQEDVQLPPGICLYKLALTQNRIGDVESARTHKGRNMHVNPPKKVVRIHFGSTHSPIQSGHHRFRQKHLFSYIVLIYINRSSYYNA